MDWFRGKYVCSTGDADYIRSSQPISEFLPLLNSQKGVSVYGVAWTPFPHVTYSNHTSVGFAAFATSVMSAKFSLEVM